MQVQGVHTQVLHLLAAYGPRKLPVGFVARTLNVSRPVVDAAIRTLSAQGVVALEDDQVSLQAPTETDPHQSASAG